MFNMLLLLYYTVDGIYGYIVSRHIANNRRVKIKLLSFPSEGMLIVFELYPAYETFLRVKIQRMYRKIDAKSF